MRPDTRAIHARTRSAVLAAAILRFGTCAAGASSDFEYSGDTGPGFWDELEGAAVCGRTTEEGARQSPIDITRVRTDERLRPLRLDLLETEISLINNGHVIEQEYRNGSILILNGAVYTLQQFHFHTLSEHAIGGRRGAMELHAVFRDESSGRLAVIGQIFRLGRANGFLEKLIEAGLPEKAGDHVESHEEINLAHALTSTRSYYRYPGSLTTPPCSEVVTWLVLQEQATLSEAQFKAFNGIMGTTFAHSRRATIASSVRRLRAATMTIEPAAAALIACLKARRAVWDRKSSATTWCLPRCRWLRNFGSGAAQGAASCPLTSRARRASRDVTSLGRDPRDGSVSERKRLVEP